MNCDSRSRTGGGGGEHVLTDSELVQRLRLRDPAAFRWLSDNHLPSIWRFVCVRVDGDQHLAEDIVSETMLALLAAVGADAEPESDVAAQPQTGTEIMNPGGWLRTVAARKVQDHYRAVARVRHLIDDARDGAVETFNKDAAADDPVKQTEHQERRAEIRDIMDELCDQYRTALEWKYLERFSVREIASRWQTTEKAVESILFRARGEFRSRLKRRDRQESPPPASASQGPRNATRQPDMESKQVQKSSLPDPAM